MCELISHVLGEHEVASAHSIADALRRAWRARRSAKRVHETQVWLAVSDDERAKVSGRYFHHRRESRHNHEADDASLQERFLSLCEEVTGASFP
jgi:hypothetical protein